MDVTIVTMDIATVTVDVAARVSVIDISNVLIGTWHVCQGSDRGIAIPSNNVASVMDYSVLLPFSSVATLAEIHSFILRFVKICGLKNLQL